MAVWACFNGYMGNGSVAVIVEAADEAAAAEQANEALRLDAGTHDSNDYATVRTVERLTLPHICELD